jgi:hypothetical protein
VEASKDSSDACGVTDEQAFMGKSFDELHKACEPVLTI